MAEGMDIMDIQDILKQLEVNEGAFPREAVLQAIEQREAITPELLHILEYARDNIEYLAEHGHYFAHLYAIFLLAQFREPRAYPLIVQFFSIPGESSLDVTGDVVTEDLGRILATVCDGDIEPIMSLIENEEANEFVRDAALESLVTLVACGEQPRDTVVAYSQSLYRGKLVREYSQVWDGLVDASTDLYPEEVYEDIKQAYHEGLADPASMRLEDVEEVLARGRDDVLDALSKDQRRRLIDDAISEMEWWACFQPQEHPPRRIASVGQPRRIAPAVQPLPKKSKQKQKDKRKRKLAKASRRKNRR